MPHYFFDLDDGGLLHIAGTGHDFDDRAAATRHAVQYLFESAADELRRNPVDRQLAVYVRSPAGERLLTTSLKFELTILARDSLH